MSSQESTQSILEQFRADQTAKLGDVPEALPNDAIRTLKAGLNATRTKFHTFRGVVRSQSDVPDWIARIAAAKELLDVTGVSQRERVAPPAAPNVAIEVDPTTGIVRLVVVQRGVLPERKEEAYALTEAPDTTAAQEELATEIGASPRNGAITGEQNSDGHSEAPILIPIPSGRSLPKRVLDILNGKESE